MVRLLLLLLLAAAQGRSPSQPISNIVRPGQPLLLVVTVKDQHQILAQQQFPLNYSEQQLQLSEEIAVDVALPLRSNLTIEAELFSQRAATLFSLTRESRNLTRYQLIRKEEHENWGVSYDPIDELQTVHGHPEDDPAEDQEYTLHIPTEFDVMVVVSQMTFPSISPQHRLRTVATQEGTKYLPPLDISQLYIPTTRSRPLDSNQTVLLRISSMSYQNYLMFYSIGHLEEFRAVLGPLGSLMEMKEEYLDQFKEFFFMNPVWLVVGYYLLACAEFFLKLAFIKSEFLFWKNVHQNKGVSLKTLFFELAAKAIFLLYLYEYQASKIILFFDLVDLLVTLWKITRTFSLAVTARPPWLRLTTYDLYKQREAIDSQSIWYMNYLLVPLMSLYLGYALYCRGGRVTNWYRFVLNTTVAFIGIFGFILMTPQLYINYKLKSVDHLNWRGLVYRFVTTIIDDLFAFMITMPALRRVLYFRDDVIFLLYIYQRRIYQTDYSRKTIFTQSSPQEQPLKLD